MKLTTLHRAPSGKFFTSLQAGREACGLVNIYPYPAVELDNGTFRLIDSDTIVAADREVTLYQVRCALGRRPDQAYFLTEKEAMTAAESFGCFWQIFGHPAIPLPDGTYRRVREGDVVRLWEGEKVATAEGSKEQSTDPALDEQLKAVALAVASFGASQAAPESVEKPLTSIFSVWTRKHVTVCDPKTDVVTPVTATPESRAVVSPKTGRELWEHVTALSFEMKNILSLPAGAARAEAKLKLIGEISKL